MSKRELERQRWDDQQRAYRERFLQRFSIIDTYEGAHKLVNEDMPFPDKIGRGTHSNLAFFLETLAERDPRFPGHSSRDECAAYVLFAERLHARGRLADAALSAIQQLSLPSL